MTRKTLLSRIALAIGFMLVLGGPTPGYIGGCSGGAGAVNPGEFCRNFRTRLCARDRAAGRLDMGAHSTCVARIASECSSFTFPVGCSATQSAVDTCYGALVNGDRLGTTCDSLGSCGIGECSFGAICGGSGGGAEPEGAWDEADMSYLEGI